MALLSTQIPLSFIHKMEQYQAQVKYMKERTDDHIRQAPITFGALGAGSALIFSIVKDYLVQDSSTNLLTAIFYGALTGTFIGSMISSQIVNKAADYNLELASKVIDAVDEHFQIFQLNTYPEKSPIKGYFKQQKVLNKP